MEKSLNELLGDIQSNYEQFIDLSEQFIDKQKQLEQPKFKRGK